MSNDDISTDGPLIEGRDVAAALGLLSRIPVKVDSVWAKRRGARAAWAYPVAGAAVGGIAAVVASVALALGLPVGLAAGFALAVQVVITGAMHEDGLADSADGLWGGWDRDRRLEIMKDSRIGTYGVLALVMSVVLRWQALTALFAVGWIWGPLVVAGALARAGLPAMMGWLPNARNGGLSRAVGRPPEATLRLALGVGAGFAVVFAGVSGVVAAAVGAGIAVLCATVARAKIGGQTGDILGATAVLVEVGVLAALLAAS